MILTQVSIIRFSPFSHFTVGIVLEYMNLKEIETMFLKGITLETERQKGALLKKPNKEIICYHHYTSGSLNLWRQSDRVVNM